MHAHTHSIMCMQAYTHNYTLKQKYMCNDTSWNGHACARVPACVQRQSLIHCRFIVGRSDAADRIGCRCHLSSMNAVRHIPPGLPQKPLFPFMLSVTLLLLRTQSLLGGRHALKSFPHACRIFIQMCERGQGSD